MRILALDLGRRIGVADGDSSLLGGTLVHGVAVESVILRGTSADRRARFLGGWLADKLTEKDFDLIITESPMNPAASKSDNATIDQLYLHGALQGIAAIFGDTKVETAPVMSIRKHFCGVAHAPPIRGRKRTSGEAASARRFINDLVLHRAILLGYLPEDSTDWDCANACAIWDFGCAKFGRARPEALVMFGART